MVDPLPPPTVWGCAHPASQPHSKSVDGEWLLGRNRLSSHFSSLCSWNHFCFPHSSSHNVLKNTGSTARLLGSKAYLVHFLAKGSWGNYLTFLRLDFLTCKVGIIIHLIHRKMVLNWE